MAKKNKPAESKTSTAQSAINNKQLTTKLTWLPAKTFELEFTIGWDQVKKNYDTVLTKVAQEVELKGFRKGKAPLEMVEKNVDKSKLYGQVLENLLPQTYISSIKQHNLRPICDPKITPLKTEEGSDWTFKAAACEVPDVTLGDYESKIKALTAKDKIWLPGKDKQPTPEKSEVEDKKLKEIFKTLLETCRVDLSAILVEEEEKRMLSRLLEQVNKIGLTLDEYLTNIHKTLDQLKQEHHHLAEETLKLEFILGKIAQIKNFAVSPKEIDDLIAALPDEKSRENLKTETQRAYIASVLRKRKVIDFLQKI